MQDTKHRDNALMVTFKSVAPPIVITTILLATGFGIIASSFLVNANFGLLTLLALVFALVCDLLLLPAILSWKKN